MCGVSLILRLPKSLGYEPGNSAQIFNSGFIAQCLLQKQCIIYPGASSWLHRRMLIPPWDPPSFPSPRHQCPPPLLMTTPRLRLVETTWVYLMTPRAVWQSQLIPRVQRSLLPPGQQIERKRRRNDHWNPPQMLEERGQVRNSLKSLLLWEI